MLRMATVFAQLHRYFLATCGGAQGLMVVLNTIHFIVLLFCVF
jgi:hypothetical protein